MPTEELQTPVQLEPGDPAWSKPPPLVALFLIIFDQKIGYTIAWKRSIPGVSLEGVVEYKSLPSGLHNVEEDLVYFSHQDYAGISAFKKSKATRQQRSATFVAIGALVKLKDGRLGKAWEHASALKASANQIVSDPTQTDLLRTYWDDYGMTTEFESESYMTPQLSPFTIAHRKSHRALSAATLNTDRKKTLPLHHPAMSTLDFIDLFGPLIFPIHRAALLRKRILLVTDAPIQKCCEFAFILSMLSSVPALANDLVLPSESLTRLRSYFAVGIHDIPLLEELSKQYLYPETPEEDGYPIDDGDKPQPMGWLACTTDRILVTKPSLYDIAVTLPSTPLGQTRRPIITIAGSKQEIKATQRDWKKYKILRRALLPLRKQYQTPQGHQNGFINGHDDIDEYSRQDAETAPLLLRSLSTTANGDVMWGESDDHDENSSIEPNTWSELAYHGFMWWASAGEQDKANNDEELYDVTLIGNLPQVAKHRANMAHHHDDEGEEEDDDDEVNETQQKTDDNSLLDDHDRTRVDASLEVEIIAYFHRLTKTIFDACAETISEGARDDEPEMDEAIPLFDVDSFRAMGLNAWSKSDQNFIKNFVALWFCKEVKITNGPIEWCGTKMC